MCHGCHGGILWPSFTETAKWRNRMTTRERKELERLQRRWELEFHERQRIRAEKLEGLARALVSRPSIDGLKRRAQYH